ncbi:MAG: hypothetical protein K0R71_2338 [Bacillales bacterium]|jgi:hypothetical protein|nr:hypothetical protein [Bacillales bacterium]
MIINWVIGGAIFAYAAWQLVKFINKSRQGKCASCAAGKKCPTKTC